MADAFYNQTAAQSWANGTTNKVILSVVCSLSVIGSLIIILTYKFFCEIRSPSRHIILCIAISDLINALANVSGIVIPPTKTGQDIPCLSQSFISSTSILCSFLWTVALAVFLFVTIVCENHELAVKLIWPYFHFVCWLLPITINIVGLLLGKLGNSTDAGTAGWCWINLTSPDQRNDAILWMFIDGKGIEILTYLIVLVLYCIIKYYLRKKIMEYRKDSSQFLSQATIDIARNSDKKMILIPLCLIILRIWGTVRFFLYIFRVDSKNEGKLETYQLILLYLQSIGDTLQGAVNCVLFCFLTPKVFKLIKHSFFSLWYCSNSQRGVEDELLDSDETVSNGTV